MDTFKMPAQPMNHNNHKAPLAEPKNFATRLTDAAKALPQQVADIAHDMPAKVNEASHVVNRNFEYQVQTRPLVVAGVAAGAGIALGYLFSARLLRLTTAIGIGYGLHALLTAQVK